MAVIDDLVAAKAAIASQISTLSTSLATSTDAVSVSVDGMSVTRLTAEQRLNALFEKLAQLNQLIQMEEQPIEIVTYGIV